MYRRSFLGALASLPLFGLLKKPKPTSLKRDLMPCAIVSCGHGRGLHGYTRVTDSSGNVMHISAGPLDWMGESVSPDGRRVVKMVFQWNSVSDSGVTKPLPESGKTP